MIYFWQAVHRQGQLFSGITEWLACQKSMKTSHNNLLTMKNLTLKKSQISPILKNHSLFSWQKIIAGDFMHLSYWCHNCITKKRQKVHKVPFQHDKRKMHKKALSIILFSSAPSCWFSKIKLPLLELKSVIIIFKIFLFHFLEICTFCLILNYNFDIELRTISKRINRQITTESKHIFTSRRPQFLEGFLQNFRLNYKWKNMYCFLFDILHSFSKSTAHTTFINNLQYPYK